MSVSFIASLNVNEVMAKVAAKLQSVSLPADAFEIISEIQTKKLTGIDGAMALRIPYHALPNSLKDERCLTPLKLNRYRLFTDSIRESQLDRRYTQELNTKPDIYCPPALNLDKFYNLNEPLYITEGELKAHAAINYGYQCIALPGIDIFYDKETRSLLPQLNKIPTNKTVILVFDSEKIEYEDIKTDDGGTKTVIKSGSAYMNVIRAKNRLAACLMVRGIKVKHITLPAKGGKMQLDDFLLEYKVLPPPQEFVFDKTDYKANLRALQSSYAMIEGKAMNVKTNKFMPHNNFLLQCDGTYVNGKPAAKLWSSDVYTMKVDNIIYKPEYPNKQPIPGSYNMFCGWGTNVAVSSSVDLSPFYKVMATLFEDEEDILEEFYKTIACMLQRPWVKQHRFLLFRGSAEGAGKSFVLDIPLKLINGVNKLQGPHSHALSDNCGTILEDSFNAIMMNKSYIVMSEVDDVGKKNTMNRLKALVTEPLLKIQPKHVDAYAIENLLLVAISTNERRLFQIDEKSRRPLVLPCIEKNSIKHRELIAMWNELKERKFFTWFNSTPVQEALMGFFMEYPLGDYDGTQQCPVSYGQIQLAEDNQSDLAVDLSMLFTAPLIIPKLEYKKYSFNTHVKNISYSEFVNHIKAMGYMLPRVDRCRGQVPLGEAIKSKYNVKVKLGCSDRPYVLVREEVYRADRLTLVELIENLYLKEGKL